VPATAEQEVSALAQRYLTDVKARLRASVPDSPSGYFDILRYHLGWQDRDGGPVDEDSGKGLRPILCLASCELAGGDWHRALPAAAALELVHNFSLLHDDIQDEDTTRRGRATAWTVFGTHQAIAAGNGMRVVADQTLLALADAGLSPETITAASVELTQRYLEMIEGQYLDMSFERADNVTSDEYLDMVARKTGALIEAAMYLGALVATNDNAAAQAFGACGRQLGLAFQVRDDLLGIWGDPNATGKPVGSDIRRKKKSMPVVFLFQSASAEDRRWLDGAYAADEVGGEEVERVLEMLDRLDARAYVQQTAERQASDAVSAIDGLGLPSNARRTLEAMAQYFVTRNK